MYSLLCRHDIKLETIEQIFTTLVVPFMLFSFVHKIFKTACFHKQCSMVYLGPYQTSVIKLLCKDS